VNLLRLSASYLRRNVLTTALNVLLLALGVATISLLLIVSTELSDRLHRDARGIDLVVGAKGSPLQLILAGVFFADSAPGNIPLDAALRLRDDPRVAQVIPLSLGDSLRGFRIVGTEPELVAHYGGIMAMGRLWNRPLEAVLGWDVATSTGLKPGQSFAGTHGLAEGGAEHGATPYRVVGILARTGQAVDRLVLTSLESVWVTHEHHGNVPDDDIDRRPEHPQGREVTLALIKYKSPFAVASLPREINARTRLQAASPPVEAARLFTVFGVAFDVLRAFAVVLIAAAALSMFTALYRAMEQRRYDIAIMRMLGASRATILGALLVESLLLAAAGAAVGLLGGHFAASRMGMLAADAAPLAGAAWRLLPEEGLIAMLAFASAILAAAIPAWRAYRLDVAAMLTRG
jgi:putative ABC transport system permease protein